MATMPRFTIMREDRSEVYAREYGVPRNSTTINTALAAIGTALKTLVLSDDEDGVWTLDLTVTIPPNVSLFIPLGVTVTGTGGLVIQGGLFALRSNWYQSTTPLAWLGSNTGEVHVTRLRGGPSRLDSLTLPGIPLQITEGGTSARTAQQARINMGLEPGVNVQPYDGTLTALAGVASAANTMPYFTGVDQAAVTPLTPFARSLLDDPDATTMRGTLLLGALAPLSIITTPYLTDKHVTYAKIQDITAQRLLGNSAGAAGPVQEITIGTGLALSGGVLSVVATAIGSGADNRLAVWNGPGALTYDDLLVYDRTLHGLSLGGHAVTSALDVQGSVMSNIPNTYFGVRVWPVAPAGAVSLEGLRIEQATGAAVGTAAFRGLYVVNAATSTAEVMGVGVNITPGTSRWAFWAGGTAPSFFYGMVGIRKSPGAVLDVWGDLATLEASTQYIAGRFWPAAQAGATEVHGLSVTGMQGPVSASTVCRGLVIADQPTGLQGATAITSSVSAGSGRYNLYVNGTANNYFAGNTQFGTWGDNSYRVVMQFNRPTSHGLGIRGTGDDTSNLHVIFINNSGAAAGWIACSATTTSYASASDVRLKHGITALTNGLALLREVRPVRFFWNVDDSPGEGFLAHELARIVPLAVTGESNDLNPDGSPRYQAVDAAKLIPTLVSAVQELLARVEALEGALL